MGLLVSYSALLGHISWFWCFPTVAQVWNTRTGRCEVTLSGHADSVEKIIWGGEGLLYSASRDRTIKVCDGLELEVTLMVNIGIVLNTRSSVFLGVIDSAIPASSRQCLRLFDCSFLVLASLQRLCNAFC